MINAITDLRDWYWFMEGDTSKVWSSKNIDFVELTDSDYLTWAQTHFAPKMSWSSLFNMMMPINPSAAIVIATKFMDSLTPDQIALAMFSSGCQIVSSSNALLNGTYAIDQAVQFKITAIMLGLSSGKGFPNAQSILPWADISGNYHTFDETEFPNFAQAIQHYVYDILTTEATLLGGHSASWPTQPVQIG